MFIISMTNNDEPLSNVTGDDVRNYTCAPQTHRDGWPNNYQSHLPDAQSHKAAWQNVQCRNRAGKDPQSFLSNHCLKIYERLVKRKWSQERHHCQSWMASNPHPQAEQGSCQKTETEYLSPHSHVPTASTSQCLRPRLRHS